MPYARDPDTNVVVIEANSTGAHDHAGELYHQDVLMLHIKGGIFADSDL